MTTLNILQFSALAVAFISFVYAIGKSFLDFKSLNFFSSNKKNISEKYYLELIDQDAELKKLILKINDSNEINQETIALIEYRLESYIKIENQLKKDSSLLKNNESFKSICEDFSVKNRSLVFDTLQQINSENLSSKANMKDIILSFLVINNCFNHNSYRIMQAIVEEREKKSKNTVSSTILR